MVARNPERIYGTYYGSRVQLLEAAVRGGETKIKIRKPSGRSSWVDPATLAGVYAESDEDEPKARKPRAPKKPAPSLQSVMARAMR